MIKTGGEKATDAGRQTDGDSSKETAEGKKRPESQDKSRREDVIERGMNERAR